MSEMNKTKKTDMFKVDPRAIVMDKTKNPRNFYGTRDEWKSHKASIKANGVKDAVLVKRVKGELHLVHGYRRMLAVMELLAEGVDIPLVKVEVAPRGYTEQQELMDHIILNSGKPLTPMEEAVVFQRLKDSGMTQVEIADALGKTQGAVSNTMKLAKLPERIQDYINEGLVSGSLVMHMLKANKNNYEQVTLQLISAIERNDGSQQKITEKNVVIKRVSKYHKLFSGSIEVLREQNVSESKITKVEKIMEALDAETPEAMAEQILAVL